MAARDADRISGQFQTAGRKIERARDRPGRADCPSCNHTETVLIGEIPLDRRFAGRLMPTPLQKGYLYRCPACHLAFRHPRPQKWELDRLYAQGSESNWQTGASTRKDWSIAADWLRDHLAPGAKVLDVGCFDGGFLRIVGGSYERFGIEIHPAAAAKAEASGIRIVGNDLEQFVMSPRFYDCVTAIDVIEHVLDPAFFLWSFSRLVKAGGYLVISTGNYDAPTWRWMGARYWYCALSEHLSFINDQWCDGIARRFGLRVEANIRFAHAPRWPLRVAWEFSKNALYKLAPGIALWLRGYGAGHKDAFSQATSGQHPPGWLTAKDHVLVAFQKL